MKEIRREVKVTEEFISYESIDGKRFKQKEDCLAWEKTYKCTIRTAFQKIPQIKTGCETAGLMGSAEDDVVILKPRDMNDIIVINAYGKMINCCSELLTQEDIGKVLMIYTGWEEDWFTVYYMDRCLEVLTKQYNDFKEQLEALQKGKENDEK